MYQYSYSEVLADSPTDARISERDALDHAIGLLRQAARSAPQGPAAQQALNFTTQMWGIFIKDLAHPQNDLGDEVRARLMSIGLWVMAEARRIENGQSRGFEAIADICDIIRNGLN